MGFGSGYSSRTDRNIDARTTDGARARVNFTNDMLAHVWAAQSQTGGQTANGNAYFRGRILYSYGSHFANGVHFGDVVFLNGDTYSVSTSGHQSDARGATRHLARFSVAGLTLMSDDLERIADKRFHGDARAFLSRFALALGDARRMSPHAWSADDSAETAGAYLASLLGLSRSWPKIHRDAVKAEHDKRAAEQAAKLKAAHDRAVWLADKSDRAWRDWMAELGADYYNRFPSIVKELFAARKLALHATRGPLASKRRLATLRERLASTRELAETYADRKEARQRRRRVLHAIADVRAWRDATPEGRLLSASYNGLRNLNAAAETLAACRIMPLCRSAANLADATAAAMQAATEESARERAAERERQRVRNIERVSAWLAGERVGRVDFDAETGGAALRIVGDVLETSHGASVPLAHAVRVFQFVKLCRDRRESWQRNGKTVRVGHFQVDRISATGDFVAGCHSFTWPEVERVARLAGVFDAAPSAAAVEPSHA